MPDELRRTVTMTTPPGDVDTVHDFLATVWGDAPSVTDEDRLSFETALIELMANVIRHADGDGSGLSCVLTIAVEDGALVAELSDTGEPGQVELVGNVMPDLEAESGRGLPLIEALVDEITYAREDDRNRWVLRRQRSDAH